MDLLTFIKKKQPQTAKTNKARPKHAIPKQLDTQMYPMKQQNTLTETPTYNYQKISSNTQKHKISIKQLCELLWKIQNILQEQYTGLIEPKNKKNTQNQIDQNLMSTDYFRFENISMQNLLERYERVIQGCQLLLSKLKNNQTIKDYIYISNSEEFLLFFKSLFGKPYVFCNMESNRKVLQVLWENQIFPNQKITKCLENLRLWIYGIALPINPAAISLHKLVLTNPELITRALKFSKNDHLYIHINRSDSLGLTPFLLTVRSITKNVNQKNKAIEKLIKNGCDIFRCPLTFITNKEKKIKQKRMNKIKILLELPLKQRKQLNAFQYLFSKKLYKSVADILYFDQIREMKQFRNNIFLQKILKQIPDCSFQLDWRTYKGMISFKTLPKDIVSVFKRDNHLRIDYHVDDIQNITNKKNSHYSLLLKSDNNKPEFFFINHHDRKITDLLHEINPKIIKKRYQNFFHSGNLENEEITYMKCQYNEETNTMQASLVFSYENIKAAQTAPITTVKQYEQAIIKSDLINYSIMEKSELKAVIMENSCNMSEFKQIKSKVIKNNVNFDIDWRKDKLNVSHLSFITNILAKKSLLMHKISKITNLILTQELFMEEKIHQMLPYKLKLHLDGDLNIQAEIKNLTFKKVDLAAFSLEYRALQNNYEQQSQNQQIASLQSTVVMDELYSVNVSRFIGKKEHQDDLEEQQANKKFQQLLMQQINEGQMGFQNNRQSSDEDQEN